MNAADIVHQSGNRSPLVKVTKVGAGYVHRDGTDYRCKDCINLVGDQDRCRLFGPKDKVSASKGYCIYWAFGKPEGDADEDDAPCSSYTPAEAGYGELKDGTKCRRCEYFDAGSCAKVEGKIDPDGCCANQEPIED